MGTHESESLGGGLGPGFRVLRTSSSAKARQDEADPSEPCSPVSSASHRGRTCQELPGGWSRFFPGKAGVTVTDGSLLVLD